MPIKICNKCKSAFAGKQCDICQKAYLVKWRAENQNRIKETKKRWDKKNKDRLKEYRVDRYSKTSEKQIAYAKQWQIKNKDRFVANNTKYRAANPEKVKAWKVAWSAANPEADRVYKQNRLERKRKNGGKLSKGLVEKLYKLQRGKCACCGKHLGSDYHLDHRMPLSLGGANEDWNLQLLTPRCNNQKYNKHPIDFMQSRGYLL